jgi:hypothetical protein
LTVVSIKSTFRNSIPSDGLIVTTSFLILFILLFPVGIRSAQQKDSVKPASQNPSPMVEYARKHERIPEKNFDGHEFLITNLLPKPVIVFIPAARQNAREFDLLIHFHGVKYVVQNAAEHYDGNLIAATVNLGSGSKVYGDGFADATKLRMLMDSIAIGVRASLRHDVRLNRVILSGFSAGYGAVRQILSTPENYGRVDAVLLLDGIHAAYLPDRKVLSEGGVVDSADLAPFLMLARDAVRKESNKKFLITHSEIFPGTYASTTESTDWILQQLAMPRTPQLSWGPLGMQQLSVAIRNHFSVFGFAGNTAPDHIDHFHGLYMFLNELLRL